MPFLATVYMLLQPAVLATRCIALFVLRDDFGSMRHFWLSNCTFVDCTVGIHRSHT